MEQRELLHKGYLRKSPPYEKIIKNYKWQKRYFKLWSDKTLEYYKSINKNKPLKEPIDLKTCTKVLDSFQEYEKYVSRNYKWPFCLETPNRHYYFLARSEEDRVKWVDVLKKLCDSVTQSNNELLMTTVLTESHSTSVVQNSQFVDSTDNYDELPQVRNSYINTDPISSNCSYSLLYTDDSIDVSNYDFLPPSVPVNQQSIVSDDCHFNFDNYTPLPPPVPFIGSNQTDDENVLVNNDDMSFSNYNIVPPPIPVENINKNSFAITSFDHDLVDFPAIDNHLNFLKSIKQHSTKHKHDEELSENLSGSSGYVPMDHIPNENLKSIEPEEYIKIVEPPKLTTINPGKEFRKFTTQSSTDSVSSNKVDACLNNTSSTLNSSHLDQAGAPKNKYIEKLKPSENSSCFDNGLLTKVEPPVVIRETKPSPVVNRFTKPTSKTKKSVTDSSYDYVCPIGSKHDNKNLDTPKFKILNGQQPDNEQQSIKSFQKDKLGPNLLANISFEHLNGTFPLNNNILNHNEQKYTESLPDFKPIHRENLCFESSNIANSNSKAYHCITEKSNETCYEKKTSDLCIESMMVESMVYENIKPQSSTILAKSDGLTYITCSYNDIKSHSKVGVQLSRFTTIDTEKSEALKNIR
ncbi:uncharacterized protein LOC100200857 isoform X1 [Hydra vulgaris]|uniref:uncharacterized protein LOC100200857 isoform X1 n=1 Tax=Hydra vulgaris TaxID=6087 RepID=UPI001F5F46FB|nr:uncharacterized protein LOC100200857 isoform X1 [Hydra vulgaris]XP_047126039.1 uncharacterized protein LOC100200857 isoform X1 [Hydra vulgaris]XP_047126040.1 uncharacterized protein LOC100200857 isoform X1 [Hydra vulgaris]